MIDIFGISSENKGFWLIAVIFGALQVNLILISIFVIITSLGYQIWPMLRPNDRKFYFLQFHFIDHWSKNLHQNLVDRKCPKMTAISQNSLFSALMQNIPFILSPGDPLWSFTGFFSQLWIWRNVEKTGHFLSHPASSIQIKKMLFPFFSQENNFW